MNDYEWINNTCIAACDIQNKEIRFFSYLTNAISLVFIVGFATLAYLIEKESQYELKRTKQLHQEKLEEHTNQILDAIYENCRVEFYKNAEKNTDELKTLLYRYKI